MATATSAFWGMLETVHSDNKKTSKLLVQFKFWKNKANVLPYIIFLWFIVLRHTQFVVLRMKQLSFDKFPDLIIARVKIHFNAYNYDLSAFLKL